jgi:hypothetical protein
VSGIDNPGYALITVAGDTVTLQAKGVDGAVRKSLTLQTAARPEIDVQGKGVSIADGDATPTLTDGTHFGTVDTGSMTRTFTIRNTGTATLVLGGSPRVQISGTAAADFVVTSQPAGTVAAGGSTTFQVKFTPKATGARVSQVTIANNDGDEAPHNFTISGVGATTTTTEWILDDGDTGFATVGAWGVGTASGTYQGDQRYSAKGTGADQANWAISGLPAGSYEVFVRWAGSGTTNRASNAPFTVFDGTVARGTVPVNQQLTPGSVVIGGVSWQRLGTYVINAGVVRVRLTDNANGYVYADAVRVVQSSTAGIAAAALQGLAIVEPRSLNPALELDELPRKSESLNDQRAVDRPDPGTARLLPERQRAIETYYAAWPGTALAKLRHGSSRVLPPCEVDRVYESIANEL